MASDWIKARWLIWAPAFWSIEGSWEKMFVLQESYVSPRSLAENGILNNMFPK